MVVPWPVPVHETAIADVGFRGISVGQLRELADYLRRLCKTGALRYTKASRGPQGERIQWTRMTMFEICNEVIKPVIRSLGVAECSWVELVASGPQRPHTFISHFWKEFFRDFMSTVYNLEMERGLTVRHAVWICTFANNQFEVVLGTRLLSSPFFRGFGEAKETALFLDFAADSLSRSWCTFELAVTTDTEQARLRWRLREELAETRGVPAGEVTWAEVEQRLIQDHGKLTTDLFDGQKPLLLCTPAGLVGSRRVTSGPVLEALRVLETCKAEASKDSDRRRILNYIAHSYFSETADESSELRGLVQRDGRLELSPGTEDKVPGVFRTNGKAEYAFEHGLVREEAPKKFFYLDENIRRACENSLRARGLVDLHMADAPELKCRYPSDEVVILAPEDSALTLAQLRIVRSLLQKHFSSEQVAMVWEEATSRDLWSDCGGNGLNVLEVIKADGCRLSQCFQTEVQKPDYFVTCSWDMPLTEMFEAIEWHAEARSLSDRATYYIDALCRTSSKHLNPFSDATKFCGDATRAMDQSSGFVLAFSRRTATRWKEGKPSLWMLYETFRAQELNLGWDLASTSGALATMRPFDNGCWAFGAFDTDIAQSLSTVAVEADKCICTREADRESILNQLTSGKLGISGFESRVNTTIPSSVLGAALLHVSYLDLESDLKAAHGLAQLALELKRCGVHLTTQRLQGAFGESALHVAAAGRGNADGMRNLLELFIKLGMDVDGQDSEGDTPLHWAAFVGSATAVKVLLSKGANAALENYSGLTPLEVAATKPASYLEGRTDDDYGQCRSLLQASARSPPTSLPSSCKKVQRLFQDHDSSQSGTISRSHLRSILEDIGTQPEVAELILADQGSSVDYRSFLRGLWCQT